jgi:hypothetical protein
LNVIVMPRSNSVHEEVTVARAALPWDCPVIHSTII